jgi:hypothetical protein
MGTRQGSRTNGHATRIANWRCQGWHNNIDPDGTAPGGNEVAVWASTAAAVNKIEKERGHQPVISLKWIYTYGIIDERPINEAGASFNARGDSESILWKRDQVWKCLKNVRGHGKDRMIAVDISAGY